MNIICPKSDFYGNGTPANNCLPTVEIYCRHCGRPVEKRCNHGTILFRVSQCSCGYYYYPDNLSLDQTARKLEV